MLLSCSVSWMTQTWCIWQSSALVSGTEDLSSRLADAHCCYAFPGQALGTSWNSFENFPSDGRSQMFACGHESQTCMLMIWWLWDVYTDWRVILRQDLFTSELKVNLPTDVMFCMWGSIWTVWLKTQAVLLERHSVWCRRSFKTSSPPEGTEPEGCQINRD